MEVSLPPGVANEIRAFSLSGVESNRIFQKSNLAAISAFALLLAVARASMAASYFPANGQSDVCPDTPLRITFDAAPATGTGKIQIFDAADKSLVAAIDVGKRTAVRTIGGMPRYNYYPVIITGNEAAIYPASQLAYNKTYYVEIDAGAFKTAAGPMDGIGNDSGWRFSTRAAPPAAGAPKLTVAADGSGDFCTVQGALDFIPAANKSPVTVFLRKGTYNEMIYVAGKNAITILGEDRKQSVIAYPTNNRFNGAPGVYRRGVLLADHCTDLVLDNLTIRNTTPQGGSQAEAIIFNGSQTARAIVTNVDLYSYQDTLQINGQAFIRNCYIEGDVDFMWGTGPCFFENCLCHSVRSRAYYTQIRNPPTNHGYVYLHCNFDGAQGITGNFLSRIEPRRFPASEVVLLDCVEAGSVGDVAWRLNAPTTKPADVLAIAAKIHFWEYNSHTPDGKPVDVSGRAAFSKQLTQPADAQTIADYSNPTFVLGHDWNPQQAAIFTSQPTTEPAVNP